MFEREEDHDEDLLFVPTITIVLLVPSVVGMNAALGDALESEIKPTMNPFFKCSIFYIHNQVV